MMKEQSTGNRRMKEWRDGGKGGGGGEAREDKWAE
jgi:hypothetical protein